MEQKIVTIEELFRQKGELVTQIEIAQNRLNQVNLQLSQLINQQTQAQTQPQVVNIGK